MTKEGTFKKENIDLNINHIKIWIFSIKLIQVLNFRLFLSTY